MTNLSKAIDELSVLVGVNEIVKAGPPREGLVPQSGDPEHPGRWIKPGSQEGTKPKRSKLDIAEAKVERAAKRAWNNSTPETESAHQDAQRERDSIMESSGNTNKGRSALLAEIAKEIGG